MSILEGVLWFLSYALLGVCVFTAAVRHFREQEWLTYEDLFEISLPFLILWPLGLAIMVGSFLQDSKFSHNILKLINGK